jgi:hypothetical protein
MGENVMPVKHVNRKRQTYFLREGKTKTGKPRYFFSRDGEGDVLDAIPEGYEIYESPNAQVFLRKKTPQVISPGEVRIVQAGLARFAMYQNCLVDVKREHIIVHEVEGDYCHPILRFTLRDEITRQFSADRWCFRGSIDDWFCLSGRGALSRLVETYCRHLGKESFFELM